MKNVLTMLAIAGLVMATPGLTMGCGPTEPVGPVDEPIEMPPGPEGPDAPMEPGMPQQPEMPPQPEMPEPQIDPPEGGMEF